MGGREVHSPGVKCRLCSYSFFPRSFSACSALSHLTGNWDSSHPYPVGPPWVSDLLRAVKKKLLQGREQKNHLLPSLTHPLTAWPLTPQFAELPGWHRQGRGGYLGLGSRFFGFFCCFFLWWVERGAHCFKDNVSASFLVTVLC